MKKISVTFQGKELEYECDRDTKLIDFVNWINEETNVPPERQMILGPIKFNKMKNIDPCTLLITSADLLNTASPIRLKLIGTPLGAEFQHMKATIADCQEEDKQISILPTGYTNIGNTCYLSSTFVLLEQAKEFIQELCQQSNESTSNPLIATWIQILKSRPRTTVCKAKISILFTLLKNTFPDFAQEREVHGISLPQQQDMEECLLQLLQLINKSENGSQLVSKFFEIQFEQRTSKHPSLEVEVPDEYTTVNGFKLSCNVCVPNVNFMSAGIELGLKEEVEKYCDAAGKNCLFVRERRLSSLPKYMIVHFVRFEWRKAAPLAGTKAGRAKVLRKVEYPREWDVYSICSDNLKKRLENQRDSGKYRLKGVVTHTGRSAIEGHYMCWVPEENGLWIKYDDDKISELETVDLQGGLADGPCPYVILYERLGLFPAN